MKSKSFTKFDFGTFVIEKKKFSFMKLGTYFCGTLKVIVSLSPAKI